MTNANRIVDRTFFVTHVTSNGPSLQIIGQFNRNDSRQIETLIGMLKDSFDLGLGIITSQTMLIINTICCAYHEDNYYRARILKIQADYNVCLHFIDYGNIEVVHPSKIRLLDSQSTGLKLQSLAPITSEFPLSKIMPFNQVWSACVVDHIRHLIRYQEYPVAINTIGNRQIFTLYYNGEDFADYLVRNQMAASIPTPATSDSFFRLPTDTSVVKQQPPYRQSLHEIPIESNLNINYAVNAKSHIVKMMQTPKIIEQTENWRRPQESTQLLRPVAPIISPRSQDRPSFKSRILEKGTSHIVYVSNVEDGPLKFSIQLQSCMQELETLMGNINSLPLKSLCEPPIPSSAVLGRCSKDKMLRRAVVSTVNDSLQVKVFYVDFGDHDTLPHTDIYEVPAQFTNPLLFSVRFILSGVRDLNVTSDMKRYFKELVMGKLLTLQVMPVEESPLMHYGNLYLNDKNILDILRDTFPDSTIKFPYSQRLSAGTREYVHVSYTESCSRFFVQLDKNAVEQEVLSDLLIECVKIAPPVKPGHIKVGLKCLAHCGVDSQWYRAEVIQVMDTQVNVHYVDYGNDEIIPINAIRSVQNNQIMKIPILAIQCILNGFESVPVSPDVDIKFEAAVLEKHFVMNVLEERSATIIVDLFDVHTKPIINISSMLRNSDTFPVKQSPITHWQEQHSDSSKIFRAKSLESDKWPHKSQNNSSEATYENTSYESLTKKNWKNTENEEKRYNIREKSNKDWNSSGDRFNRDHSRSDRYNRDSTNRFDSENTSNNHYRDKSAGRRGFSDNRRAERNNGENTWSDRDSNASSRSSGKRGRRGSSRGSPIGARGGRRDSQDGASDRGFNKYNQSNDRDFNKSSGNRFRSDNQKNDRNDLFQNNEINRWNSSSATTSESLSPSQIPPPNITLAAVKQCQIVFSVSPVDFYVQLIPDNAELQTVMHKIAEIYQTGGTNLSNSVAKVGMYCIAQYSEDSKWYRAVIKSLEPSGALVRFVDYGNTEVVSFDKIKEIDNEYIKLPTQAIYAKLLGVSKYEWESSELEKFSVLTEGKLLEAEFLAIEEDIYQVLLREVVDNAPQGMYINEEFTTVNLMEAKEVLNRKSRPKSPETDYAPLNQKWIEAVVNLQASEDVIITWTSTPNNFYSQFMNNAKKFRAMMMEIQKIYARRQPTNDNIQIGSSIIATFIDDGAFYRAEVIDIKPDGIFVRYVDFGNCAMIQSRDVYNVDKKFMNMPIQAVRCTLKNVVPPGNSWSTANPQEIDSVFDVDKFQCTFYEMKNDKYVVSLNDNGNDLANIFVEKGLAIYEIPSGDFAILQGSNVPEVDYLNIKEDLTKLDISCLKGQILRVHVSCVKCVTKFHIQLPSISESEKIIADFMANRDPRVMPRLLVEEICLGAGCLIQIDAGWRRATVIDCSRKTDFDVRFIDTGEVKVVSLNDMLALPRELTRVQKQAVQCALINTTSSISIDDELRMAVEHKDAIIRVYEVKNNMLIVDIFDDSGEKIKLSKACQPEKISPLCPMPVLCAVHRVSVTHINHARSIWLKRIADLETDCMLLHDLYEYYSTLGQLLSIEEGKLCAALNADGNWYRARVIKKIDTGALVQYIDYGNTEEVISDSLKELRPRFFKPFALALEVSLEFSLHGTEAEQQKLLNTHLLDKELYATLHIYHGLWFAALGMKPGSNIVEDGSLQGVIEYNIKSRCEPEPEDLTIGYEYAVTVSHVDNPTQFWLQREKNITAIQELSAKLRKELCTYEPVRGIPEDKLLYVVYNWHNRLWCRAEVIDAVEGMTTVRFVDYGNTDVIIASEEEIKIRQLPDSMKSIEWYAMKCRLNVIPIATDDWPVDTCIAFESQLKAAKKLTAVLIADSNPMRVELYNNNVNIVEWLVKEELALLIGANESVIEEIIEYELDPKSAFVSHINSPGEFWVQEQKNVPELELISDRFIVAEMFPKVDNVQIGSLYVAQYDDNDWYRAKAISHEPKGTNVFYIDYGNSIVSNEIREIPEDLVKFPPLSRKCCLALPEDAKKWSKKASEEFIKMANEGQTVFILDVLVEGEISLVTLTLDGDDIVNHLKEFCESEIIQTSLIESSNTVLISHVTSPNEFWIQEKYTLDSLLDFADKLSLAEEFPAVDVVHEGLVCIAKFPEDSMWYRAQVLSHGDTGTNVNYIDYGNSAISTDIRKIPIDLKMIPPFARKCSLMLPDGVDIWSDGACEEFYKQWDEGNTEFLLTILGEAETSVVKLWSKKIDKDITEHLAEFVAKQELVIEERLSPLGEENSPNAVISHVVSPAEFWIRAGRNIVALQSMTDLLVYAENFHPVNSCKEGMICAAKFPEDKQWRRAKVLNYGEDGTEVLYIDFGNSAVSRAITQLCDNIIEIPPMAKLCSLKMPEAVKSWSKEACEKFRELAADGVTIFEYKELELGENSTSISLLYQGQDVVEILEPLCKKIDNKADTTQVDSESYQEVRQESVPTHEDIPIITKTEMDSTADIITEKHPEDNDKTDDSTSGIGAMSSDYSTSSHTLGQLEPSPEIANSTLKPADESNVKTAAFDIQTNNNTQSEETIIVLDSTEENIVVEREITIEQEILEIPLELNEASVPSIVTTEEVRDEAEPSNNVVKITEISTMNEVAFKIIRRTSLPLQDNESSESQDVASNEDATEDSTKCDTKMTETPHLELKSTDEAEADDTADIRSEETLNHPSTPKTPHSEKFVAGVVTDHRVIESDDDEILEVAIIKREPQH